MPETTNGRMAQGLAIGLLLLGMAARFAPHPANVTPLAALALFGGAYFSRRWGILLPLATIIASDLVIGLHDTIAFTWGACALTGLIGWWVRRQISPRSIVGGSVMSSTLFFLLTNFGVWWLAQGGAMYPKTLDGLISCYVAGLPFYRNALLGDVVWAGGLFGLYALATRGRALESAAPSR